jgi:hypothetical protein
MSGEALASELSLDWPRLYEQPDASINFLQASPVGAPLTLTLTLTVTLTVTVTLALTLTLTLT